MNKNINKTKVSRVRDLESLGFFCMPARLSRDEFINRSIEKHGLGLYSYDDVDYVQSSIKVKIKCIRHNRIFTQRPKCHLEGKGCPICGKEKGINSIRMSAESFKERAIKVHGDLYNYDNIKYKNIKTKIKIFCNRHNGFFFQRPDQHLIGKGCGQCSKRKKLNKEDFIKRARDIHGDVYSYDMVEYKRCDRYVYIYCLKHKAYFSQTPNKHMLGRGCPICNESKGERAIRIFLDKMGINFKAQHSFSVNRRFKYDFFIPSHNLIIELHGKQHYSPVDFFGGIPSLLAQSKRDIIKKHYCLQNGIPFLEIPFWEQDNIETILSENINS